MAQFKPDQKNDLSPTVHILSVIPWWICHSTFTLFHSNIYLLAYILVLKSLYLVAYFYIVLYVNAVSVFLFNGYPSIPS